MPDSAANVQITVTKPGGVEQAAEGFYQLAKAAKEAANEVKGAQSAGSAFANSLKKQNKDSRKEDRAAAAQKAQADYEAYRKQKQADEKQAATESKLRTQRATNVIGASGRGGVQGALGALGGKAGLAGAIIDATGQLLDRGAKAADILNDSYATGAQKTRALFSEFVPLGDKILRFGDALSGATDKIKRQVERMEITKAQDEARFAFRGKLGAANLEDTTYKARLRAARGIGISGFGSFDRSTLAGERAAQRQDTTIGAQDELTRAVRESAAAKEVAREAQKQVEAANQRVNQQTIAADNAKLRLRDKKGEEAGVSLFRDKAGVDKAAREAENEAARLSKELASRETIIAAAKEKGLAAIQAEAAARAASVNLAKAELAVLQQQESRMRSLSQGVGGMSQGERLGALNALKAYQENGGNAPPEIEALVAKLAPDLVRKNQENRGNDFISKDVREALGEQGFEAAFGGDFSKGNTLKEVMAKVDKAKADIRVTIDLDAQGTAAQLAALLKPVLENLKASFQIEVKNIENRIKAGNAVRNNAAN